MAVEQQALEDTQVIRLIEGFLKIHEQFRDPSDKDIDLVDQQVELHLGSVVGKDRPDKIAGNLAFFRMSHSLYPDKKRTMTELSEQLMIEKWSTTRLVSWWVDRGLAERFNDPNDRRVIKVALTEKGRQFHKTIESITFSRARTIFQRLSAEELTTFMMLFEKLVAGISNSSSQSEL